MEDSNNYRISFRMQGKRLKFYTKMENTNKHSNSSDYPLKTEDFCSVLL